MTVRKALSSRAVKVVLDAGIVCCLLVFAVVALTGQMKLTVFGTVIKERQLFGVFEYLVPLVVLRLLVSVQFKNFVLVIASLAFGLALAELTVRAWDPPIAKVRRIQIHRASPIFGWELIPGAYGVEHYGQVYQINSAGFRDHEFGKTKEDGALRIAAVGDSFTFGMGVNLEETYPKQLERMLTDRYGPVEVLNFGVIAHGMWQHYEVLRHKALAFDPDFVVLALWQDDLAASVHPATGVKDYKGENPFFEKKSPGFMNNFALWNLISNTEATWQDKHRYLRDRYLSLIEQRKKLMGPANPTSRHYMTMAGKLTEREYREFEKALTRFVATARNSGAEVLVVLIPDAVQLKDPHLQAVNRYLQDMTGELGVPFLDVTPQLEREADPSSLYLFPHDAHNSPKGLRIIAAAIADKLTALRWVGAPDEQAPPAVRGPASASDRDGSVGGFPGT